MLEKMKSVSNPLTIIALFAALAEVAGTVAIKLVAPELQSTFIWFVMIFPILIVVLFFFTLNFNAKVLYAPGDFKNEENYLAAMNATKSLGIEKVQAMMAEARTEIISEVMKTIPTNGVGDRNKVQEIVNEKLQPVQDAVEDVKSEVYKQFFRNWSLYTVEDTTTALFFILSILQRAPKPLTIAEIVSESQTTGAITREVLSALERGELVKAVRDEDGEMKFVAADPPSKAR